MQSTNRAGLILIGAAVIIGIGGDLLLRAVPWGINVGLFAVVVVLIAAGAARLSHIRLAGGGRWLAIPAVIFASAFAWRDSFPLLAGDFVLMLIALALYADRGRSGRLRIAGLVDYALGVIVAGVFALFGAFLVIFEDIKWREARRELQPGRMVSVMLRVGAGILIAVPLLLIFGALFAAADANFASLVQNMFNWDMNELLGHLLLIAAWAWVAAGFLHMLLLASPIRLINIENSVDHSVGKLGIVEIGTALGLLDILFLAFVVLQFRYLFGGASALGYAEYARRGFFELVAVAALVLPVLLVAHWLLRKDNPAQVRLFNTLAGALILLLFVIMLSALQRMGLYVSQFGLTELRLYTTAFIAWLALVFAWFILTVLRGQREKFVFGGLMAGLLVALVVNLLNPDYFIARTNVDRVAQVAAKQTDFGRELDAAYLSGLSADALPVLLEALPNVPEPQRCHAATMILARWSAPASPDWRSWNSNRAQAWQLVEARHDYLQGIACPQTSRSD